MTPHLLSKLPRVGTTIFTVMSRLAAETGALNLSQGFPSFEADPVLLELVTKYLRSGLNQYAPMAGVPALREALARKTAALHGATYDPETEITITSGATEALFAATAAVVRPGDEVLVFEPAYDSYVPAIELCGGVPVFVTLTPPEYAVDWNVVRERISNKTRLVFVNTPHNPTGRIWTDGDFAQLTTLVRDRDLFLVGDEVYEHIVFDGRVHRSLAAYPELRARSFVCSSFGKTFHVTGWKVGSCLAPAELTQEFRKIHQYLTFSTTTPIQHALAEYLAEPERYLGVPAFYQRKRDFFLNALAGSRFGYTPAEGSFFQTVSYDAITDEPDTDLAVRLTHEIGVASIPISVFYDGKHDFKRLRFCFAKDDETLERAAERLRRL
jgi:methionine aminotransferase